MLRYCCFLSFVFCLVLAQSSEVRLKKVLKDLKDKEEFVRFKALKDLGRLAIEENVDLKKVMPPILLALNDSERSVCAGAARVLGNIVKKRNEAFPYLESGIKNKDISVRMEIVHILTAFGGIEAYELLIKTLLKDRSGDVRYVTIRDLVKISETQTKEAEMLIDGLHKCLKKDKKWDVRYGAIEALGNFGLKAKATIPTLIKSFKSDKRAEVKKIAAKSLGEMGKEAQEATPFLKKSLQNRKEKVEIRGQAAIALIKINEENAEVIAEVVALLKEMLQENNSQAIAAALEGLKHARSKGKAASDEIVKIIEQGGKHAETAKEVYSIVMNKRYQKEN